NVARQKFSIDRLSFRVPPCLHQDENYHHTGVFADDKYRRPWKRVSVISTQKMMDLSVLDQWKQSLYVEDFLEKKPISCTEFHINNELIEVVPSSNPYSQTDIEEAYLLIKDDYKEEFTQVICVKPDYVPVLKAQDQAKETNNNKNLKYKILNCHNILIMIIASQFFAYKHHPKQLLEVYHFGKVKLSDHLNGVMSQSHIEDPGGSWYSVVQDIQLMFTSKDTIPINNAGILWLIVENLYIADDLVFVDNLKEYRKQLPTLRTLLARLKIFLVKDPLLNSKGQILTEENLF
ncbi:hypothetical protein KIL84_014059, partial [Mauremys mutica]